jgi:hypothetical protein
LGSSGERRRTTWAPTRRPTDPDVDHREEDRVIGVAEAHRHGVPLFRNLDRVVEEAVEHVVQVTGID